MIQELYDRHIFLYIMGGLCILGVFLKCFLLIVYNRLIDSSENMNSPKKSWMKNMKLRFEGAYQLQLGVSDVDTYVDKYVSKVKCGGLLLSTWENISGQTIGLCLIVGSFSAILGLVYQCGQKVVLFTFFMGAWTAIIVNIVDNIVNLSAHKQMLRYNLIDYFENNLKVRMEQEVFHSEDRKKYQREYFTDDSQRQKDNMESTCFERRGLKEVKTIAATKELIEKRNRKEAKRVERKKNQRSELEQEEDLNNSLDFSVDQEGSLTKRQKKEAKRLKKEKVKQQKKDKKEREIQEKLDRKQSIIEEKRKLKLEKKESKKNKKEQRLQEKERKNREKLENKKRHKDEKIKQREQEEQGKKEELLKNNKAYKEKMRLLAEKQREAEKAREEAKKKEELKKEIEEKIPDIQVVKPQSEISFGTKLSKEIETTTDSMKKVILEREKRQTGEMTAISKEEDLLIEQVLQDFLSDKP